MLQRLMSFLSVPSRPQPTVSPVSQVSALSHRATFISLRSGWRLVQKEELSHCLLNVGAGLEPVTEAGITVHGSLTSNCREGRWASLDVTRNTHNSKDRCCMGLRGN